MRNKDGTMSDAEHICYSSPPYDSLLRFSLHGTTFPTMEETQAMFTIHSSLDIPEDKKPLWGDFDSLYTFVYGQPISAFAGTFSLFDQNRPWAKTWKAEDVANMDWGMFCMFFWTFLCTKDTCHSSAWDALHSILVILRQEPQLLLAHFSHFGYSEADVPGFWSSVYQQLSKRFSMHLNEENCAFAYSDLVELKKFLPTERYLALETKYCIFFDKIARSRIQSALAKNYSAQELIRFDIEKLFFYKDFFALSSSSPETKNYIYSRTFDFLYTMGNHFLSLGQELNAYSIYQNALTYAQCSDDRAIIVEAQKKIDPKLISAHVGRIASDQAKNRRKQLKSDFSDALVPILGTLILLSIPATIIFGIWSLIHATQFSIIALSISAVIATFGAIILIPPMIRDKRDKNK